MFRQRPPVFSASRRKTRLAAAAAEVAGLEVSLAWESGLNACDASQAADDPECPATGARALNLSQYQILECDHERERQCHRNSNHTG